MSKISASFGTLYSSSWVVIKVHSQFLPGEIESQKIQDPEEQTPGFQRAQPGHPEIFSGGRESAPDRQGGSVASPDSSRSHLPHPKASQTVFG